MEKENTYSCLKEFIRNRASIEFLTESKLFDKYTKKNSVRNEVLEIELSKM